MNKHYTRAPHRGDASDGYVSPNAALLIDFDNVTMAIRSNLAQELENLLNSDVIRGKVAVQRAYADWRRYPQYIVPLSESSIDLIFAPAYGSSKKNATDIRLAIDALELVFTRPEIGTFILLSGDSDFSSLVLKLKEYGKYVIGVGMQESSSDILVQNCDEYYSYTSLSGLREASEVTTQRHDPWDLVDRALRRMTERNDVMRSDRLKQVMLELDPGFDEGAIGYSKFNRFLAEAASRHKLKLRKAANGQYEVSPVDGGASSRGGDGERPKVSRGRQERSRSSGGRRRRSGRREESTTEATADGEETRRSVAESGPEPARDSLRAAYDLLGWAVTSLSRDGQGVRDSEVKRKMLAREADFDETALGFRKFSRFLQQAHDEGIVDLRQRDDGNYYLTPTGVGPARDEDRRESVARPDGRASPESSVEPSPEPSPEPSEGRARKGGPASAGGKARRGLGRFRRGSRAPSARPAGAEESAATIGPVESRTPPDGDQIVEHMVRNYPGVGERTATLLVETFGEDVFEVIDREPDRVEELLSGSRARAVIEARTAERASR